MAKLAQPNTTELQKENRQKLRLQVLARSRRGDAWCVTELYRHTSVHPRWAPMDTTKCDFTNIQLGGSNRSLLGMLTEWLQSLGKKLPIEGRWPHNSCIAAKSHPILNGGLIKAGSCSTVFN